MKKADEILYWQQEFPELDEEEILEILEEMMEMPFEEDEGPEKPRPQSREIEDYTKYW